MALPDWPKGAPDQARLYAVICSFYIMDYNENIFFYGYHFDNRSSGVINFYPEKVNARIWAIHLILFENK
jgi:hypothetical protein